MESLTKSIRGTQDVLPDQSYLWQAVQKIMAENARVFGYKEIITPVFEHTELFERGVGDTTDVVQKEMYTFNDKGGRSITLRPEGTAGAIRSVLEHNLHKGALPLKTYYFSSCYRYEKPQAGRLREFHQFGAEMIGTSSPVSDAEVIALARSVIDMLGIKNITLFINSIGCPTCRANFQKELLAYFGGHKGEFCGTCLDRMERNPMRIFDCKSPVCGEIAAKAPVMLDHLCEECKNHFGEVQTYLQSAGIEFSIDPRIVRGLDYYTKTVFEFVSNDIGSQGTVCGGGRYDGLIEELSGEAVPALGFGMGIERTLLVMKNQGVEMPQPPPMDIYIASMTPAAARKAFELVHLLREDGFYAECDHMNRGLKAQMKYADKAGASFTMILGEDELSGGQGFLKSMKDGQKHQVPLDDRLVNALYQLRATAFDLPEFK